LGRMRPLLKAKGVACCTTISRHAPPPPAAPRAPMARNAACAYGGTARSLDSSRCVKKSDQPPPRTPLGFDENVAGTPRKTLPTDAFSKGAFLRVNMASAVLRGTDGSAATVAAFCSRRCWAATATAAGGMRRIGRLGATPVFSDDGGGCEDLSQLPSSWINTVLSAQTNRPPGGWITSAGGTGGGR